MEVEGYRLNRPEDIETPAFLVYEHLVRHNIREIIEVCGSASRVIPHAKTHKSAAVLRMQTAAGITAFKVATLKEAELLAENGVKEILIAHILLHPKKLDRFVRLKRKFADLSLRTIVSRPEHLEALSRAAAACGSDIDVYIDLDTGMHRTGVQTGEEAGRLYAEAAATPGLNVLGVHIFDGQMHRPSFEERETIFQQSLDFAHDTWDRARRQGLEVVDNVAGGSWSFHYFLRDENFRVSPGTWIYWDASSIEQKDLGFKIAALVLGQAIDRDDLHDTVTLDIGSKAISSDPPTERRFKLIGHPSCVLTSQSEEHGVVKLNGADIGVGEFVFAAPGHVCTASAKYPEALVVGEDGNLIGTYDHSARDR